MPPLLLLCFAFADLPDVVVGLVVGVEDVGVEVDGVVGLSVGLSVGAFVGEQSWICSLLDQIQLLTHTSVNIRTFLNKTSFVLMSHCQVFR